MFEELLNLAEISKAELGRRLGLHRSTVYEWGSDAPRYATAYLEVLIELRRSEESCSFYLRQIDMLGKI